MKRAERSECSSSNQFQSWELGAGAFSVVAAVSRSSRGKLSLAYGTVTYRVSQILRSALDHLIIPPRSHVDTMTHCTYSMSATVKQ